MLGALILQGSSIKGFNRLRTPGSVGGGSCMQITDQELSQMNLFCPACKWKSLATAMGQWLREAHNEALAFSGDECSTSNDKP